jgi:hypothetical protein
MLVIAAMAEAAARRCRIRECGDSKDGGAAGPIEGELGSRAGDTCSAPGEGAEASEVCCRCSVQEAPSHQRTCPAICGSTYQPGSGIPHPSRSLAVRHALFKKVLHGRRSDALF